MLNMCWFYVQKVGFAENESPLSYTSRISWQFWVLKEAFLNCFQVNSGVKRWRGAVLGTYSGGIFIFGARTVEHMKNTVALLFWDVVF